jgi:DNA-binding CsgD family transcriptional regulator
VELDERMRAAIARLTENEKECLRRRLLPQTAKEMALELGVSPHAVEKRLKMARTKLGLSSSLQAARLLVQAESQSLVPQASDLAAAPEPVQRPSSTGDRRWWWIGGIMMSIAIAAALALTLPGAPAPQNAPAPTERKPATPEEVPRFLGRSFDRMDEDHSGYLEAAEAPRTTMRLQDGQASAVDPKRAGAMFIARSDLDGDGKVSRDEWIRMMRPPLDKNGLPVPRRKPG